GGHDAIARDDQPSKAVRKSAARYSGRSSLPARTIAFLLPLCPILAPLALSLLAAPCGRTALLVPCADAGLVLPPARLLGPAFARAGPALIRPLALLRLLRPLAAPGLLLFVTPVGLPGLAPVGLVRGR